MPIGDLANDAVTVAPETSVATLAKKMRDTCAETVVVTADEPIGVVGERDVVHALADSNDIATCPVSSVMTGVSRPIRTDATAFELMTRLLDYHHRNIPVVDHEGSLVGVVGIDDVVSVCAELLGTAAELNHGESTLHEDPY